MITLKRCSRCQADKPSTAFPAKGGARCKECNNEKQRLWRLAHGEAIRRHSKTYRLKYKETIAVAVRAWHESHPERIKEMSQRYYANNKELIDEKSRAQYKRNSASVNARVGKWRADNPETVRAMMSSLRAKRMSADGSYSSEDVRRMMVAQESRCAACKADLTLGYHVDHVMPLSKGGTNWPCNLQLLCPSCNHRKGRKTPDHWNRIVVLMASKNPTAIAKG